MGNGCDEFAHGRQPGDACEISLSVSQRLLGPSALGDVHDRTDEFYFAGLRNLGLADRLHMFDRSVWQNDSVLVLKPASFAHGVVEYPLVRRTVLRVSPVHECRVGRRRWQQIVGEETPKLRGGNDLAGVDLPAPAAGTTDLLRLSERALAPP